MLEILNPETLIYTVGLVGILAIVFAESGLFFGFFLPGDSLLFTAGFLASQGYLPIWTLVIGSCVAAILGDSVGYAFGAKVGPRIFNRENSRFFHKNHLLKAQNFYEKYGVKTIILARFMPIVRTFAPILAGVGNMRYSVFLTYNIVGGIVWAAGMTGLGYFLGNTVPGVDRYIIPIVLLIIIISVLPSAIHLLRERKSSKE